LIALDVFVGATGVGGGIAMATGVDRFPSAWLADNPFDTYLIPGIILALVVGGSAAAASVLMIKRHRRGPLLSALSGAILIGWIVGEILLLEQPAEPTRTEVAFLVIGAALLILGLAHGGRSRPT
jgi:peptidoglycan/LPS O-acetylase OafA/YrhL